MMAYGHIKIESRRAVECVATGLRRAPPSIRRPKRLADATPDNFANQGNCRRGKAAIGKTSAQLQVICLARRSQLLEGFSCATS